MAVEVGSSLNYSSRDRCRALNDHEATVHTGTE